MRSPERRAAAFAWLNYSRTQTATATEPDIPDAWVREFVGDHLIMPEGFVWRWDDNNRSMARPLGGRKKTQEQPDALRVANLASKMDPVEFSLLPFHALYQDALVEEALSPAERAVRAREEQIRGLPVEHAFAVSASGRVLLEHTSGLADRVEITPEQAKALMDDGEAVFTHNHPRGGCLSADDLALAMATNLREIRAVGPDGDGWRVLRPKKGWPFSLGSFHIFRGFLGAASTRARERAAKQMDRIVRAAGGSPADGVNAKGYDDGTWKKLITEALLEEWNRIGEAHGGWKVEAFRRAAGPAVGRPHRARRQAAGVRGEPIPAAAEPSGQLILFQGEGEGSPRGFTRTAKREFERIIQVGISSTGDLSTFLHESGHAFLHILGDLAALPDAPQKLRDDFEQAMAWTGFGSRQGMLEADAEAEGLHRRAKREKRELTGKEKARLAELAAPHEKFARGFEAYLFEGQAPSVKLEGLFATFRLWLKRVYRSITSLGVELNDDIRGVFDRMLASEREVARTRSAMGAQRRLFKSPEEAGMTPEQWAGYLKLEEVASAHAVRSTELRVLKDRLRATEAWWKEEQAELQEAAAREYEDLPARRAQRFIRGEDPASPEPLRFDRAALEAAVGPANARRFRGIKKGGVAPDDVAHLVGYPSGATMLQAVLDLPTKEKWAKEKAEERMGERYPDILQDKEALRKEVAKGLHGGLTSKWLEAEFRALKRKVGEDGRSPHIESVKRAARAIIERRAIRDIHPGRILIAERAAAEKKFQAAARGNVRQALVFAQQQLLNHHMHRVALEVHTEAESAENHLQKRTTDSYRAGLGKANPDFLAVHDAILGALGFARPQAEVGEQLAALERAAAAAEADGAPFEFDLDALRTLLAQPRRWRSLTISDVRNVRDAVMNIRAIANAQNEVTLAGEKQEVEDIVERLAQEAEALPDLGKARASREQVGVARKALDFAIGAAGELIDPEELFGMLGQTGRAIFNRYLEGKKRKYQLTREALDPLLEAWEKLPAETLRRRFEVLPDLDRLLPIPEDVNLAGARDRIWLIMVALNLGNESNKERLLGGYRWQEPQVVAALNHHLTKEEWDWVQSVWDLVDRKLWPHVAEKEQRKTGLPLQKIRPTPIDTPFGRYSGGYFPARYDPRASAGDVGERQAEQAIASLYGPGYVRASTLKSHTKKRAIHYENVINLDWSVVPAHLAQVLHDVAFDEFVRDTGRILFHPRAQQVLFRRLGEKRATQPREWLKFVANAQAVTGATRMGEVARLVGALKSRMVVGAIGWSIPVMMGDFTNALVAMARGTKAGGTSARWGIPAYLAALPHPGLASARRLALAKSSELNLRVQSFTEERRQQFIRDVGKRQGRVTSAIKAVANTAWFLMRQTDKMASTQIWLARYWHELHSEGKTEEEAVEAADRAVRANLPSPERAELPKLVRDPASLGAVLVFFGYFSKLGNIVGGVARRPILAFTEASRTGEARDFARAGLITAEAAGRTLAVFFFANVVGELLSGRGPEDDEETSEWLLRKMLAAPFSLIPLVGPFADPVIGKLVTGKSKHMSIRAAPALSLVERAVRAIGRAADEGAELGERLWGAAEAALIAAGLPATQPRRTLDFLISYLNGEAEAEGPVEVVGGLAYGERENQPLNPATAISGR